MELSRVIIPLELTEANAPGAATDMLDGLYKVEMHTVHGSRQGILYVCAGKMFGGTSAFVFVGTYGQSASEIWADMRGSAARTGCNSPSV